MIIFIAKEFINDFYIFKANHCSLRLLLIKQEL